MTSNKYTHSKDGTKIAYDVSGSGPTLIQIYGATCFKDFMPIKDQTKVFAKEFTVYNYDRRGRGDSDKHTDWSIDAEIEDIEALIDAAGGEAFIYGHSSGAVLALEAALRLPAKVKKVVIYDASYVATSQEKTDYSELKTKVSILLSEHKPATALRTFLTVIGMPKAFVYLMPLMPGWGAMKCLAPTLLYDIALTEDLPPVERFRNIQVPVCILAGGKNPDSILKVREMLAAAIPNNESRVLEDQDHMAGGKVLLPELVGFLKQSSSYT